jgi:hypothetical protein
MIGIKILALASPRRLNRIRFSGKSYLICSFLFALILLVWFFGRQVSQVEFGQRPSSATPTEASSRGTTGLSESDGLRYRSVSHAEFFTLRLQGWIVLLAAVVVVIQGLIIGFVKTFWAEYEEFRSNELDWAGYPGDS